MSDCTRSSLAMWSRVMAGAFIVLGLATPALAQTFVDQTSTRFPGGLAGPLEYTNQLTVGDLDGDGDLDIVFANGGNFGSAGAPEVLRVYINSGLNTGVFADESVARTGGLTFLARGVELGDIERDGDLDIIIAQDFNRQPTLLVNNGAGVFTNETATRLPIGTFSSSRAQFADIDNDGDLDLYLTNGGAVSRFGTGRGKLYLNNGSGVFTDATAANTPVENVTEPQDCIFGDIDGDFDLDLRIGSTAPNQSKLYVNNGSGGFAPAPVAPSPDANCYSYDFGDMNGDGDLDLIGANGAASGTNAEIELVNNGAGVFTTGPFVGATSDDNDSKFLDIDNDGDLDLIIARIGGAERVYTNNGAGLMTLAAGVMTAVTDSTLDVKVADFDSDGRYDIVTAQGESGSYLNRIYMNTTGAVDNRPPTIVRTEQLGNTSNGAARAVRVEIADAHTSDRGFHDKGISLRWRRGGSGRFASVNMPWSGNGLWRGVIPAQTNSGLIEYYVEARDFANNLATGPTLSYTLTLPCPGNVNGDAAVNVTDLLAVISAWGATGPNPADVSGDGIVNVTDLLAVISAWGACP